MNLNDIKALLAKHHQSHLLDYYDTLNEVEQTNLLKQIENLDFSLLDLIKSNSHKEERKDVITPIKTLECSEIDLGREDYLTRGINAIQANQVGLVLLAGGQGTRLGFDKPKGMLNVGLSKPLYLFEMLINNILDVVKLTNHYIPLFIMTSNINNEDTVNFFKEHNYFNYPQSHVHFFIQEMSPACSYDGKILLSSPSQIALSPNGNGGWFSSLVKAGYLSLLEEQGIKWLNVFSVDNVLQRIGDPIFLGAILAHNAKSGSKVVRKTGPEERVGVICLKNGLPSIVEYYELSEEMRHSRDDKGDLLYNFGVTLNYFLRVEDLVGIISSSLPVHIVEKKVPYFDGEYHNPTAPNGYKFETLILDMLDLIGDNLPFEVIREKEFAPIKNATGSDSIDTARELLKKNGIEL